MDNILEPLPGMEEQHKSLSQLHQNILSIQFPSLSDTSLFSINWPYLITFQNCTGIAPEDTIRMTNFSLDGLCSDCYTMDFYHRQDINRPLHKHDYYELMLVVKGEILYLVEDKQYRCSEGYGCLINRNIKHSEQYTGQATLLFIGLSVDLVNEMLSLYQYENCDVGRHNAVFKFIQDDFTQPSKKQYLAFFPSIYSRKASQTLNAINDELIGMSEASNFGTYYQVCGLICKLTESLSDKNEFYSVEMEIDSSGDYMIFQRIHHLMEDTNGRITRHELEAELNYSGNYLNKIVKKHSGMSLFEYGTEICMKKAKDMLCKTDISTQQIISELGFTNSTHFYSLFRKRFGMTPGEYRKEHTHQSL